MTIIPTKTLVDLVGLLNAVYPEFCYFALFELSIESSNVKRIKCSLIQAGFKSGAVYRTEMLELNFSQRSLCFRNMKLFHD